MKHEDVSALTATGRRAEAAIGTGSFSEQLDPHQDDSATVMPRGYTAIETYINEVAENIVVP